MDFIALTGLPEPCAWAVTVFLGLVLGSFASAMAYRVPRGQSWVSRRSACPSCGHVLSVLDLVPVFSWVFLRGRCRHCRAEIGWRYPAIELATLLACLAIHAVYGLDAASVVAMLAMPFLVSMAVIDIEYMILPDQGQVILGVLGLCFILLSGADVAHGLAGAVVYGGLAFLLGCIVTRVLKKDALGFGDVKFFAVAGLWLGPGLLPVFLIVAGIAGIGLGAFWKIYLRQDRFPFGPALILSFLACLLLGPGIEGFSSGFL